MRMIGRDGAVVDIPDDKVQEAFQSGQFGFERGAKIPVVSRLGRVAKVDATQAEDAFSRGARLADPTEYDAAVREAKYGSGLGNIAAAGAEGVARGLTGGISDPLAIAAAKHIVGPEAGEAVREHLAGEKEEQKVASGVGEVAGLAGGLFIPGAGEAEAANLAAHAGEAGTVAADAARASGIAEIMGRGAAAVPRGIAHVGEATDKLVGSLIGRDAASAAGKAAQKITARAAAAAAEGGAFGVANQIDEDALGDHDTQAGKLLSAGLYGGLLGGATGGLLTGAGELAREVSGQLSPTLRRLAGDQAWRAANPPSRFSETAIRRAGGREAVGQAVLDDGILENASSVDEVRDRTIAAVQKRAQELHDAYAGSPAKVTLKDVEDIFDEQIKHYEGQALHGDVVSALKQAKTEFMGQISPDVAEEVAAAHAPTELSPDEIQGLIKEHGPSIINDTERLEKLGYTREFVAGQNGAATLKISRIAPEATPETVVAAGEKTRVPIQDLIEQRQALGRKAYQEQLQNDPKGRVKALRDVYGKLADLENTAFEEAERTMGGVQAKSVKDARLRYQRLSLYKDALEKSTSRFATNRNLSITDYMMGAAGLASGHGIAGVGGAMLHKLFRERGNAWAARYLDKLAGLSAIERATSAVDREVDRGVSGFFRPGERSAPRIRARVFTGPKDQGPTGDYQTRVDGVAHAVANPDMHADHIGRVAGAIEAHAPNIANSFQKKALAITSYLAGKIPQGHVTLNTASPHLEKPRVSDVEKAKFNRAFDMAHDPVGTTFGRLNKGMLTATDVANLRSMHPEVYDDIRSKVMEELATQGTKIPFDKRMQVGLLLDIPADPAIEPLFMQTMQKTYQDMQAASNAAQPTKGRAAPKRQIDAFAEKSALSV